MAWMSDSASSPDHAVESAASLLQFCRGMGRPVALAAQDDLFREGTPARAVLIEQGEAELILAAGKKQMPLGRAFAGHLLGLAAVIRCQPHECSAVARTACRVVVVEAEAMRKFLKQHPESCLQTLQFLGSEIVDLSSNVIRPLRLHPRYPKP